MRVRFVIDLTVYAWGLRVYLRLCASVCMCVYVTCVFEINPSLDTVHHPSTRIAYLFDGKYNIIESAKRISIYVFMCVLLLMCVSDIIMCVVCGHTIDLCALQKCSQDLL